MRANCGWGRRGAGGEPAVMAGMRRRACWDAEVTPQREGEIEIERERKLGTGDSRLNFELELDGSGRHIRAQLAGRVASRTPAIPPSASPTVTRDPGLRWIFPV